jgi:hypothetical protein
LLEQIFDVYTNTRASEVEFDRLIYTARRVIERQHALCDLAYKMTDHYKALGWDREVDASEEQGHQKV